MHRFFTPKVFAPIPQRFTEAHTHLQGMSLEFIADRQKTLLRRATPGDAWNNQYLEFHEWQQRLTDNH